VLAAWSCLDRRSLELDRLLSLLGFFNRFRLKTRKGSYLDNRFNPNKFTKSWENSVSSEKARYRS
jgi:hypothetical protein